MGRQYAEEHHAVSDTQHYHQHVSVNGALRSGPSLTLHRYFHVVASNSSKAGGLSSVRQVADQLNVLNGAFNKHKIGFKLAEITRTVNSSWSSNCAETEMKRSLRKGTYADLNVYIQPYFDCIDGSIDPDGNVTQGFGE